MAYLALTYPILNSPDLKRIQDFRRKHDPLYFGMVDPHFTLVFPIAEISREEFVEEVNRIADGISGIDFRIESAIMHKDELSDYFHCFLVPDHGKESIINFHDQLYAERFKKYLRTDIEYIPHIGIGRSLDEQECEKMVDEWNASVISISGKISRLTVASYVNSKVSTIEELVLR